MAACACFKIKLYLCYFEINNLKRDRVQKMSVPSFLRLHSVYKSKLYQTSVSKSQKFG